eukprot:TRINITY_DN5709_c0_g1_i1.p1 TRINITY_DN5709_c0_g1~~TRINITY_DN5709_c0_g1_i1.p1  ORF type:complete len:1162 (+),score=289.37 TRINITY_DN5709_c0_g1_i1:79-3564(+)
MVGTPSGRDVRTPVRDAAGTPTRRGSVTPIRSFTPKVSTPKKKTGYPSTSVRSLTTVPIAREELPAPVPAPIPMPSPSAQSFQSIPSPQAVLQEVIPEPPALDTQQQVSLLAQLPLQDAIRCVTTAKDGKKVWTGDRSGAIRIRETYTGEVLTPSVESQKNGQQCPLIEKPGVLPNVMAYTPNNGGQVWVGFSDGFVRVFSYETDMLLSEMIHHNGPVLAILADGATVYSAGHDWKITQWSSDSLKCVTTYTGHRSAVRCLAMSPECLISGSDDGTVRTWNASRRGLKGGHLGSVLAVASVKNMLWSAGDDGVICVWDHDAGTLLHKLAGHKAPVTSLLVIEGGDIVWSTDKHGVVIVWDTAGPEMLQRMSPDSADWQRNGITASCIVHRAVNWRVWTCSGDGSVRIWNTPSMSESAECSILRGELGRLQHSRDSSAVQLESLMAAQDTVALKTETEALRAALDDQQQLLIQSDHRIVEMAAETDNLRFEIEKYRGFETDFQQERQRRIDSETHASRTEAKLVVSQQEVVARTSALTIAEEERQKHRAAVDRLIEIERELEGERQRRLRVEETIVCFEAQNAELRSTLSDTNSKLKETSSTAKQQSSVLASQRDHALHDVELMLRKVMDVVVHAEIDSRAIISDLEYYESVALEIHLQDLKMRIANTAYVEASPARVPASPLPIPRVSRDNEEVLTLRIQSLETALSESHKRCVSQSCDEQNSIARAQQLESLLLAHQAELAETASEFAKARCDLDSKTVELQTKDTEIVRLQENAAIKESELVDATTQLQRYKQQLEQNIMCIGNMEEKLKYSQEEAMVLSEEKESLKLVGSDLSFKIKELESVLHQREAALREIENHETQLRKESQAVKTSHEVLRCDMDEYRIRVAKQEEVLLKNEEEKCELVLQCNETSTMLDRMRTELKKSEADREAHRKQVMQDLIASDAEKGRLQASVFELTGLVAEKDAQLEVLQVHLDTKTEQLSKQTNTLGEVMGEVTERRRATTELEGRLHDLELASKMADNSVMKHREASMQADVLRQNDAAKWHAEKASLEGTVAALDEELRLTKNPFDALKMQLDTTLRELALTREDSQCEIKMLQRQLAAKGEELARARNTHLSPPGSPGAYVLHTDADLPQHTPAYHTESYPSLHSRSLSPRAGM